MDMKFILGRIAKCLLTILAVTFIVFALMQCNDEGDPGSIMLAKPVIYLYPEETTLVTVKLDVTGQLTAVYPAYEDGWRVTAAPDGTLTDENGRSYYCLYWEAESDTAFDLSQGFCVPGESTAAFLVDALAKLGLTEREANEFIIYWLPRMQANPYNLISFQTDVYEAHAKLAVEPAPDTLIRVFMAWQGVKSPVELPPQTLSAPERHGFTVVEWGGTEIPLSHPDVP